MWAAWCRQHCRRICQAVPTVTRRHLGTTAKTRETLCLGLGALPHKAHLAAKMQGNWWWLWLSSHLWIVATKEELDRFLAVNKTSLRRIRKCRLRELVDLLLEKKPINSSGLVGTDANSTAKVWCQYGSEWTMVIQPFEDGTMSRATGIEAIVEEE